MTEAKSNIRSIGTSAVAGLAGGAAIGSLASPIGALIGAAMGALVTGYSEYLKEKNAVATTKRPKLTKDKSSTIKITKSVNHK